MSQTGEAKLCQQKAKHNSEAAAEWSHIICWNYTCSATFIYFRVFLTLPKALEFHMRPQQDLYHNLMWVEGGHFGGKQTNGVVPLEGSHFHN